MGSLHDASEIFKLSNANFMELGFLAVHSNPH